MASEWKSNCQLPMMVVNINWPSLQILSRFCQLPRHSPLWGWTRSNTWMLCHPSLFCPVIIHWPMRFSQRQLALGCPLSGPFHVDAHFCAVVKSERLSWPDSSHPWLHWTLWKPAKTMRWLCPRAAFLQFVKHFTQIMCLVGGLIQNYTLHGDGIRKRYPKVGFEAKTFQLNMFFAIFARNSLYGVNVFHLGMNGTGDIIHSLLPMAHSQTLRTTVSRNSLSRAVIWSQRSFPMVYTKLRKSGLFSNSLEQIRTPTKRIVFILNKFETFF